MKVRELIQKLYECNAEADVMLIAKSNPCGNIWNCRNVKASTYGFFGVSIDCVILGNEDEEKTDDEEQN